MYFLKIIFLSLGSIAVLFIVTKIMGNREISQLSMFDYIIGITIGSIAAEMATSLENNFWEPVIAMVVYGLVATFISYITCKSIKLRKYISGKASVLYDNGIFFRKNFARARLDINEFLMQCRINGFFNLANLQTAILEPNGKISFLPSSSQTSSSFIINVITDGVLLEENLKKTGNDIDWLYKELKKQKISGISNIFLATCDSENNLTVYMKTNVN